LEHRLLVNPLAIIEIGKVFLDEEYALSSAGTMNMLKFVSIVGKPPEEQAAIPRLGAGYDSIF
jgi:hypothetical protein